eukprot:scaffold1206_cov388-Prasinococcus_capsulatus_cf.AAC.24
MQDDSTFWEEAGTKGCSKHCSPALCQGVSKLPGAELCRGCSSQPKKKGLFSFNKPEPKPEQQMAKADWLGLGGFTLDNFIAGGKDRDGVCSLSDQNGSVSRVWRKTVGCGNKGASQVQEQRWGRVHPHQPHKGASDEEGPVRLHRKRLSRIAGESAQSTQRRVPHVVAAVRGSNEVVSAVFQSIVQSSFGKKKGQQLNASQQKALRMRITGTARDFFKAGIVQYQGKYVESGWTDKKTVSNTNSSSLIGVGVALVGIMATLVLVASQTS